MQLKFYLHFGSTNLRVRFRWKGLLFFKRLDSFMPVVCRSACFSSADPVLINFVCFPAYFFFTGHLCGIFFPRLLSNSCFWPKLFLVSTDFALPVVFFDRAAGFTTDFFINFSLKFQNKKRSNLLNS